VSASLLGVADLAAASSAFADDLAADIAAAALAAEPLAVARYRELGIPDDITAQSLADVGRKISAYGATVDLPWLVSVMRGDVLAFGRIQLERKTVDGARALHIPEGGPLDPDEIDRSLAAGRAFLGDDPVVCTSWLLDPLLLELPAQSNIAAFARRFTVDEVVRSEEADHAVAKFVFRLPLAEALALPPAVLKTSVERRVYTHLRSGAHWSEPRGILTR
jgi:hypothetical protein